MTVDRACSMVRILTSLCKEWLAVRRPPLPDPEFLRYGVGLLDGRAHTPAAW